ncbi:MAG: response regulator transcription factor [Gammaproteobacteria bacterium]|nr:response regulator transcription factor [Gammaproteobacteria bacterium]
MTAAHQHARVLMIEDHRDIAEMVGGYLEGQGYELDYAADGVTGLHLAVVNDYDVVILDLMLPGLDGLAVCRRLREDARRDTPVLMLTARDTQQDKITGLDSGADDYLVKPFDIRELEARVRALVRRARGGVTADLLQVGDLTLDTGTHELHRAGQRLTLTPTALKVLTVLMRASPRIVSRHDLEHEVWGDLPPDSDTLRSHLYTLRKVIDRPFDRPLLHTVHGAGYRLAVDDGE